MEKISKRIRIFDVTFLIVGFTCTTLTINYSIGYYKELLFSVHHAGYFYYNPFWVMGVFLIFPMTFIFQPVFAILSDRYGRFGVLFFCSVFGPLSCLILLQGSSTIIHGISFLLISMFMACYPVLHGLVCDRLNRASRMRFIILIQMLTLITLTLNLDSFVLALCVSVLFTIICFSRWIKTTPVLSVEVQMVQHQKKAIEALLPVSVLKGICIWMVFVALVNFSLDTAAALVMWKTKSVSLPKYFYEYSFVYYSIGLVLAYSLSLLKVRAYYIIWFGCLMIFLSYILTGLLFDLLPITWLTMAGSVGTGMVFPVIICFNLSICSKHYCALLSAIKGLTYLIAVPCGTILAQELISINASKFDLVIVYLFSAVLMLFIMKMISGTYKSRISW